MAQYQTGQIVWAKIKGFPWWPAMIAKIKDFKEGNEVIKEMMVNFIGDNSHAVLPESKVLDFISHPNQNKSKKNKKLIESIKTAHQIVQGNTTFEEEMNKLLQKPSRRRGPKSDSDKTTEPKRRSTRKNRGINESFEDLLDEEFLLPEKKRITRSRSKSSKTPSAEDFLEYTMPLTARKSTRKKSQKTDDSDPQLMQIEDKKREVVNYEKLLQTKIKQQQQQQQQLPQPLGNDQRLSMIQQPQTSMITPVSKPSKPRDKKITNTQIVSSKDYPIDSPTNLTKRPQTARKPPEYQSITTERDLKNTSSEFIYKKPKLSPGFQKKLSSIKPTILKDRLSQSNLANQKNAMNYNKLMISKFENDLEILLNNLSLKCSKPDQFVENDPDLNKLFNIMTEFDKHVFNGPELINSNIGKLFKTIHYLLVQNKPKLNKTGDFILSILAKIVHKIKEKIIRFCLDNSEYLTALNIPATASSNEASQQPRSLITIDIDMVRTKIEELEDTAHPAIQQGTQPKTPPPQVSAEEHKEEQKEESTSRLNIENPIQTKIEEENRINKSVTIKAEAKTTPLIEKKLQTDVSPGSQQAGTAQNPSSATIKKADPSGSGGVANMHQMIKKRFCQKLAPLLQNLYSMDKDRSQNLTLTIEGRIRSFYPETSKDFLEEYKQAIKAVYRLIKSKTIKESELESFVHLDLSQFRSLYLSKMSKASRQQRPSTAEKPQAQQQQLQQQQQQQIQQIQQQHSIQQHTQPQQQSQAQPQQQAPQQAQKQQAQQQVQSSKYNIPINEPIDNRSEESRLFEISFTPGELNKQTPSFEDKLNSPLPSSNVGKDHEVNLNLNKILNEESPDRNFEDD